MRREDYAYEADPVDLIQFADAYASLGDEARAAVKNLIDGEYGLVDATTFKLVRDQLGGFNDLLDEAFSEYLAVVATN